MSSASCASLHYYVKSGHNTWRIWPSVCRRGNETEAWSGTRCTGLISPSNAGSSHAGVSTAARAHGQRGSYRCAIVTRRAAVPCQTQAVAPHLQAAVHAQHVLELSQLEGDRHHGAVVLVPGQSAAAHISRVMLLIMLLTYFMSCYLLTSCHVTHTSVSYSH